MDSLYGAVDGGSSGVYHNVFKGQLSRSSSTNTVRAALTRLLPSCEWTDHGPSLYQATPWSVSKLGTWVDATDVVDGGMSWSNVAAPLRAEFGIRAMHPRCLLRVIWVPKNHTHTKKHTPKKKKKTKKNKKPHSPRVTRVPHGAKY